MHERTHTYSLWSFRFFTFPANYKNRIMDDNTLLFLASGAWFRRVNACKVVQIPAYCIQILPIINVKKSCGSNAESNMTDWLENMT